MAEDKTFLYCFVHRVELRVLIPFLAWRGRKAGWDVQSRIFEKKVSWTHENRYRLCGHDREVFW